MSKLKDFKVRLTAKEKDAFFNYCKNNVMNNKAVSANAMLVTFIRNAINQEPHFLKDEVLYFLQARNEIKAVGRNLNQLVKLSHKGKADLSEELKETMADISASLVVFEDRLKALILKAKDRGIG